MFGDNQHSTMMSCFDDLYQRLQDMSCRFEGQERRLEDYQDQIRYMTKQLESQVGLNFKSGLPGNFLEEYFFRPCSFRNFIHQSA